MPKWKEKKRLEQLLLRFSLYLHVLHGQYINGSYRSEGKKILSLQFHKHSSHSFVLIHRLWADIHLKNRSAIYLKTTTTTTFRTTISAYILTQ